MFVYEGPLDYEGFYNFALEDYQRIYGQIIPKRINLFQVIKGKIIREVHKIMVIYEKRFHNFLGIAVFFVVCVYLSWSLGRHFGKKIFGDDGKN